MDALWLLLSSLVDEEKTTDLLQRMRARDPQALADAYDVYSRLVFVLVVRIVRDPAVAEDLVQEAFLRAWRRADTLNEEFESVGPWLTRIARHCALDYLKSRSRREVQSQLVEPVVPALVIENDLLNSEQAALLGRAFDKLSANQRRVIELAYYEGLSQSEIAEQLDQPLGTVKSWTRAALQRLREEISIGFAAAGA